MYKVLIVEEAPLERQMLRLMVGESKQFTVAAALSDADDALAYCAYETVDLIVMDVITGKRAKGLKAAELIKTNYPTVKIILISAVYMKKHVERAWKAGVEGFWFKSLEGEPLYRIAEKCMAGDRIYPSKNMIFSAGDVGCAQASEFTEREIRILHEMLSGDKDEEIAARIGVTKAAVRWHIQNMLQKTGYRSKLELALRAFEAGLIMRE